MEIRNVSSFQSQVDILVGGSMKITVVMMVSVFSRAQYVIDDIDTLILLGLNLSNYLAKGFK